MNTPNFKNWLSIQEATNQPRDGMKSRWSVSYKRKINCNNPKGFSQKNYCKRKKRGGHYLEQSTLGTEDVNAAEVESIYAQAKKSVMMVRDYDAATGANLLTNISTIANLASGAYGLYVSSENKKSIGPDIVQRMRMIFPKDAELDRKLHTLPKKVIMQYVPNIDPKKIIPSDVIRINVRKHLSQYGDTSATVVEIASSIVHEATHVKEFEETGATRDGPGSAVQQAEASFKNWAKQNWKQLSAKYNLPGEFPF